METIKKIQDISLGKLNNAEFSYFANQVTNRVMSIGVENLHIPTEVFDSYKELNGQLISLLGQSRTSEETAEITDIDMLEDEMIVSLMANIRNASSSPIASKKAAGTALYIICKPYTGLQRLPQRQQVQTVEGLLSDLDKGDYPKHLNTLGLKEEVAELKALNARYIELLDKRAKSQAENGLTDSKPIRLKMSELYDVICCHVFANNLLNPTTDLDEFIVFLNKLVNDVDTAYKHRKAT